MYSQIDSNKRKSTLLIILFIAFVFCLGWIIGKIAGFGYYGIIIALFISLLMTIFSYYSGDKVALLTAGAKQIAKNDNPYLYRIVENLCITAGLPLPKIYIIPDQAINAFATGRDPQHASLAVTQGAIDKLKNEELEGVIAHELSHIKNYDIRLMTLVIILVGAVAMLADIFLRWEFYSSSDRDNKNIGPLFWVGIILVILSPLIAQLIQLAISRKREFLADADGALLTRYPEGLARALEKIAQENQGLKRINSATAHLYFASPFGKSKKFLSKLFSTHPPLEERIKALREMIK